MIAAMVGYIVGSLPLGFLIARGRRGIDLRRVGSGNVGAANVYRSAGRSLGVAVMLVDVAKGASGVWLARFVDGGSGDGAALAGLGAVVGHVYPIWLRFVGGKGVAVACGVFALLAPLATVIAASVFVLATWMTRYVSLGSVLATLALPAVEWTRVGSEPVTLAATAVSALVLFRHRGNLARILHGTERRLGQRAAVNS
ncbi:MAG: glycerol-3-phosphate 1-O-acyltransferase PlsY [Acidobacteria bacterium]|nr:glycerol-3-phosphate 1-O-acyltransferase PlsY [Acidobacteriota bacterium]